MPTILITRPRAMAETLARELESLGYQTVMEPLLEVTPLAAPRPSGAFDAVMITSGNAVLALEKRKTEIVDLFNLPCFCVGPRTAEKASALGFQKVQSTENDGAELARFAADALGKKSALLHLAGRDVDSKAQGELEQRGHKVTLWPLYEAKPVAMLTAQTRGLMEKRQLDAVLVFSPRTAETLAALLAKDALEACCAGLTAICLSPAVAGALKPFPWRRLAVASAPAEQAVIATLQDIFPVKS